MNNLVQEYENQKKLFIDALVEKQYLEIYETMKLKNDFVLKLGEPRYELFKIEMEIARNKLKLEMMETSTKFEVPVDTKQIDMQLEKEFEKHAIMLKSMKKEIEDVHNTVANSETDFKSLQELKEMYVFIASYVHPELTGNTDRSKKRAWNAARAAFEKKDIEKMKKLHKKVLSKYANAVENNDTEVLKKVTITLKFKTDLILSEIDTLKMRFPFNEAKILGDEAAVAKYRSDMQKDIQIAREVLDKLEKQVLEKLPERGGYLN